MKQYRQFLILLFLALALGGCFTARPPNNSEFAEVSDIRQLQGVYQNIGESKPGTGPHYLSAILWGNTVPSTAHKLIKTIEVRVVGDKTLSVKAQGAEGVIKEEVYVEGKDFNIVSGRIRLKQKLGFGGEGIAGPTYEAVEIGLDQRGHGKYSEHTTFAGIVLLVPFAFYQTTEVRFVRLGD